MGLEVGGGGLVLASLLGGKADEAFDTGATLTGPRATVTVGGKKFACGIAGHGEPIGPFSGVPAADLETPLAERRIGGLGIHITKRLKGACSYERCGGSYHAALRKRLG
jgi:hypothetical protein